ncbi:MAG TPA: class I adenylate-forming enzyme family protein, partial [Candidatus Hydrogenedentes bacterium]|nr:class I adenylate-forming enzyme family protein [Candidatus Hydrogenedentota bacterium]
MLNLAHFLDVTAEKYPDNTAVILDDFKMTWRELAAFTHRVANILRSKGIGKGDTVAMMVPNTPHFPMIYYGILHTGAAVVPVNVMYRHNEIEHYLIDSEAKVFFAFKVFEEEARKAFLAAENCKDFIVISSPDDLEDPAVGENFTKIMMEADSDFDTFQTMPDDTAVI